MPINVKKPKMKRWLSKRKRRVSVKSRKRRAKIISFLAAGVLFLVLFGVITVFSVIAFFSRDLPSPEKLSTRKIAESTKIYSRDGVLLYEIYGDERRTLVSLDDIPEYLKQATIAVEDKDFYSHEGFDMGGILRSAYRIITGTRLEGGSTITQQVVKNTLLSPERTYSRKIKELILSIELERKYTKDEILQMYFNESPYGGQAWGVGAAAEMYFGKDVKDLTLAEATLIAGLPQAPSLYSPCGAYPENAKKRQEVVLSLMVKNGYITKQQKDEVLAQDPKVVCYGYSAKDIKAPHFVLFVKNQLTEMFGEKMVEQGGLRVYTTLDWKAQQVLEEEAKKQIDYLQSQSANASQAGVITVDPKTGQILGMVGSVDYFDKEHDGNVNVILAERQPGSSIKPITYLTAFMQGYSPSTYVSDIKTCFPGGAGQPDYCPGNWDDKFWGPMSMRTALANSRNIPAVKTLQLVGMTNMIETAHMLGITTLNEPDRYGLSLTLGGGEVKPYDMAQAYATIDNMGVRNDLTPFLKITDSKGKVLKEYKDTSYKVIDPRYVYLLLDVLTDYNTRKRTFGNSMEIGRPLAVKTGTTNNNKDAWTIGMTPQLVTVVWVGNFDGAEMRGILGSTGATPIMKGVMSRLLADKPIEKWEKPKGIVSVTVDNLSGLIPQEGKDYPSHKDIFVKGSEPTKIDDFHITVKVCKSDPDKLATQYHIDNDLAKDRVFIHLNELMPAWQKYTDEWMKKHKDEGYGNPPKEKCPIEVEDKVVEGPLIEFVNVPTELDIDTTNIESEVKVYTVDRITKVEFYWDDNLVITTNSEPYKVDMDISRIEDATSAGTHVLTVKAYDSEGNESELTQDVNVIDPNASPTPTPEGGVLTETPTPTPSS